MSSSSLSKAKSITIINLKGGVGKTHITWLLSTVCQDRRHRCLVVDLDQQANITSSFLTNHTKPIGIERLIDPSDDPEPEEVICSTPYSHIDIIPATGHLARLDASDMCEWEQTDSQYCLVDTLRTLSTKYEYVFLDCPPRISLTSYAALCATQYVVIPLEAADWGARGTPCVTSAIDTVRNQHNSNIHLLGYIVSRYKHQRSYQQEYFKQLRRQFGQDAFFTVIPDRADFEKAVTDRSLPTLNSPYANVSPIAHQLFDETEHRIERHASSCTKRRSTGVPAFALVAAR